MKTIGFIGGMSWESSLEYYRIANETVNNLHGGFASCRCLMYSVDFALVEKLQHTGDWGGLNELMGDAARRLHRGGAELIVICTNTMHLCADAIRQATPLPFLHIADATGKRITAQGLKTIGLLGTRFTMEMDFYKRNLLENHGVHALVPEEGSRETVHRIIYKELVRGIIRDESREIFKEIIGNLQKRGAEGVVLGCTEIPLLISQKEVDIPVYDSTRIHAEEAVYWALA